MCLHSCSHYSASLRGCMVTAPSVKISSSLAGEAFAIFFLKFVFHFVVFSFVVNDEFDFEYLDHMVCSMCPPVETDKLDDSR